MCGLGDMAWRCGMPASSASRGDGGRLSDDVELTGDLPSFASSYRDSTVNDDDRSPTDEMNDSCLSWLMTILRSRGFDIAGMFGVRMSDAPEMKKPFARGV